MPDPVGPVTRSGSGVGREGGDPAAQLAHRGARSPEEPPRRERSVALAEDAPNEAHEALPVASSSPTVYVNASALQRQRLVLERDLLVRVVRTTGEVGLAPAQPLEDEEALPVAPVAPRRAGPPRLAEGLLVRQQLLVRDVETQVENHEVGQPAARSSSGSASVQRPRVQPRSPPTGRAERDRARGGGGNPPSSAGRPRRGPGPRPRREVMRLPSRVDVASSAALLGDRARQGVEPLELRTRQALASLPRAVSSSRGSGRIRRSGSARRHDRERAASVPRPRPKTSAAGTAPPGPARGRERRRPQGARAAPRCRSSSASGAERRMYLAEVVAQTGRLPWRLRPPYPPSRRRPVPAIPATEDTARSGRRKQLLIRFGAQISDFGDESAVRTGRSAGHALECIGSSADSEKGGRDGNTQTWMPDPAPGTPKETPPCRSPAAFSSASAQTGSEIPWRPLRRALLLLLLVARRRRCCGARRRESLRSVAPGFVGVCANRFTGLARGADRRARTSARPPSTRSTRSASPTSSCRPTTGSSTVTTKEGVHRPGRRPGALGDRPQGACSRKWSALPGRARARARRPRCSSRRSAPPRRATRSRKLISEKRGGARRGRRGRRRGSGSPRAASS